MREAERNTRLTAQCQALIKANAELGAGAAASEITHEPVAQAADDEDNADAAAGVSAWSLSPGVPDAC